MVSPKPSPPITGAAASWRPAERARSAISRSSPCSSASARAAWTSSRPRTSIPSMGRSVIPRSQGNSERYRRAAALLYLSLFLQCLYDGLAFDGEDEALADVGAVVGDALQFVRDPEQVGRALEDERVVLQRGNSARARHHRHQIVAYQVIAHVNNVILLPDVARALCIALSERLHRALQYSARFVPQVQDAAHDRFFGDLRVAAFAVALYLDLWQCVVAQRSHTQDVLRDPGSSIAGALKIAGYRERRGEIAQIAPAERLLQGQETNRVLLDGGAQAVDQVIALDHHARFRQIAICQGLQRVAQRLIDERSQAYDLLIQYLQLFIQHRPCHIVLSLCAVLDPLPP